MLSILGHNYYRLTLFQSWKIFGILEIEVKEYKESMNNNNDHLHL